MAMVRGARPTAENLGAAWKVGEEPGVELPLLLFSEWLAVSGR